MNPETGRYLIVRGDSGFQVRVEMPNMSPVLSLSDINDLKWRLDLAARRCNEEDHIASMGKKNTTAGLFASAIFGHRVTRLPEPTFKCEER